MNEQNLIPFSEMDPDKHRALSSLGGQKSGEARQERRKLREELTALLSSGEIQQRVCLGLIRKAEQGDPRAFMILRDTLGERLPDGMSIEVSGRSADLNTWKEEHQTELEELWREDAFRDVPKYQGIWGLLTYEDRKRLINQELTVEP